MIITIKLTYGKNLRKPYLGKWLRIADNGFLSELYPTMQLFTHLKVCFLIRHLVTTLFFVLVANIEVWRLKAVIWLKQICFCLNGRSVVKNKFITNTQSLDHSTTLITFGFGDSLHVFFPEISYIYINKIFLYYLFIIYFLWRRCHLDVYFYHSVKLSVSVRNFFLSLSSLTEGNIF